MAEKLILAFDNWTGGIRHFDRVHPALKEAGYTLRLYHSESWEPDVGRPALQSTTGIEMIDVGKHTGLELLNLFGSASPEAVIFLSVDTFTERAINRFCQRKGIPTLWLNHGLTAVQEMESATRLGARPVARVLRLLPRVQRLLVRVVPTYIASLRATNAPLSAWTRVVGDTLNMALGWNIAKSATDCRCSANAIYTDADLDYSLKKYGYRRENVFAVGNPDIIDFGIDESHIGSLAGRSAPGSKEIVYVDTRLVQHGFAYASNAAFINHLIAVRAAAQRQGYSLVLKLHPGHGKTSVPSKLRDAGFELLGSEDFSTRLLTAAAAIVEPSSADLIPALLGLPVLAAKFGALSDVKYGPLVRLYPRGSELTNLDDIDSCVTRLWLHSDVDKLQRWIAANAGPLPAGQFATRVVEIIRSRLATGA